MAMPAPSSARDAADAGVLLAAGGAAASLFAGRDAAVLETYRRLAAAVSRFGPTVAEVKKTSIHLVAGAHGSAFAGVHPRRKALLLTIRSAAPLASSRVRKVDQVSKHRFHNDVLVAAPADVDRELLEWLHSAYSLASGGD
jgi:hypothetical protein